MIKLLDVIKYFKGEPNQLKAIEALEKLLGSSGLAEDAEWVKLWRTPTPAASTTPLAFTNTWHGIKSAAKAAGAKFPEVVAAQWALESAFGKVVSGKHNYFGVKGPGTVKTTWEDYGNGPVTIQAEFKDYPTPYKAVEDLVNKWYKDYRGHTGVNRATSREQCAYLLKVEGYATDPIYAEKLIRLMKQYD